ncbi:hypothetical protein WJX81_007571 [Elliptochloris bilobata]|uniref:Endonuclease/exonuclease/phosphatase domain-containing protein n=1 Tax=Elliptochloris bilobata TaxID=381761 RepID=A0AAW1PZM0_9CHLO
MKQGAEATAIITAALPPSSSCLRIVTYNIWFTGYKAEARMKAISAIIQACVPDVIMLQEVTSALYGVLADSAWFDNYVASSEPDTLPEWMECCNVLLLKKATFSDISPFRFKLFPNSNMGRGLLFGTAEAFGTRFCFVDTHLESPMWSSEHYMFYREREAQLENALEFLEENFGRNGVEVVFGGDLNWIDAEQGPLALPPGWMDPWPMLRAHDPGFTYDASANRMLGGWNPHRSRLDRFCLRLHAWDADRIAMEGRSAIPDAFVLDYTDIRTGQHLPILPSDHFGLLLQLRQRTQGGPAPANPIPKSPYEYLQKRGELRG